MVDASDSRGQAFDHGETVSPVRPSTDRRPLPERFPVRVSDVQVAVIGESPVDVITGPGRDRSTRPGGSPLNVAVGLGRLGIRTELTTQIGRDHYGELIRAHLAEAGVHLSHGGGRTGRTSTASEPAQV
ncbi:carbohydrate kinase family protein [Brachybacterium alimentarium]|uniref:carbohydrate kinase family protein n=1 Tax=Brachybacterium alimentarium TaxID=47845 RepID=UPI003FD07824